MANVEGEHPDPDQLDLSDEDLILDDLSEDSAAEDADLPAEAEQHEEAEEEPKKKRWGRKQKEQAKKKERGKKEKVKKPAQPRAKKEEKTEFAGLGDALATADVFTVMLGLALLAVVIAVCCLLLELKRYDFDVKAEEAKRQITTVPAAQLGPASRTAAAWPIDVRLTNSAEGVDGTTGSPWIT